MGVLLPDSQLVVNGHAGHSGVHCLDSFHAKRARRSALPPYSSVRWLKMAEEKLPHIRSPCTCTMSKPACFASTAALPKPAMI